MDESIVRALVIGATFAVIGVAANLVWKLIRSTSETAHRARRIVGAALVVLLLVGLVTGSPSDRTFVLVLAALVGAVIWIMRGSKKS